MIAEALRLFVAVLSLHGDGASDYRTVRQPDAARAAVAITVTRGDWPAELVATLAIRESSMRWKVNPRSGACGPGQLLESRIPSRQARFCEELRKAGPVAQYAAISHKLTAWRRVCARLHRRDLTTCAIAGYVGGGAAVLGGWRRTARAILRRADVLRVRMLLATAGTEASS